VKQHKLNDWIIIGLMDAFGALKRWNVKTLKRNEKLVIHRVEASPEKPLAWR